MHGDPLDGMPKLDLHHELHDDEHEGDHALHFLPPPDGERPLDFHVEPRNGLLQPAFSLSSIPKLHSNASATAKLYLDFDGHFDATWGAYSNITTPVYDIDGDATTFSQQELDNITAIWQRVAEDFAPFNIDVTTENPGNFANGVGMRLAIGGDGAWTGNSYGGIAYVNTFTWTGIVNTAYVFADNLWNAKNIAEATSHEAGHSFGLNHQSSYDANGNKTQEYNKGGNGWAPIMGVGYSQSVTTWHDGPNSSGSTSYQDDMSILSGSRNGFGYRADDHGGSAQTASQFASTGASVQASGLIAQNSDTDWFSFSTFAGTVNFTLDVTELGANLDAVLELRAADGSLITTVDPDTTLGATLSAEVDTGTYYLVVRSTGQYGHVGTYTIDGSVSLLSGFSFENSTLVVTGSASNDAFRYLGGQNNRILYNTQVVEIGTLSINEIRFDGAAGRDRVQLSDGDTEITLSTLWSGGGRFQTGRYQIELYNVNVATINGEGDTPATVINITGALPGEIIAMSGVLANAGRQSQANTSGALQRQLNNSFEDNWLESTSSQQDSSSDWATHHAISALYADNSLQADSVADEIDGVEFHADRLAVDSDLLLEDKYLSFAVFDDALIGFFENQHGTPS